MTTSSLILHRERSRCAVCCRWPACAWWSSAPPGQALLHHAAVRHGAEVVKIEPPAGDGLRQWPPLNQGYSENFASPNRNKRSAVLNLKDPQDVRAGAPPILRRTCWSKTIAPA